MSQNTVELDADPPANANVGCSSSHGTTPDNSSAPIGTILVEDSSPPGIQKDDAHDNYQFDTVGKTIQHEVVHETVNQHKCSCEAIRCRCQLYKLRKQQKLQQQELNQHSVQQEKHQQERVQHKQPFEFKELQITHYFH